MTLLNTALIGLLVLVFAGGVLLLTRRRDGARKTTPTAPRGTAGHAPVEADARPPEAAAAAYVPSPGDAEGLLTVARQCLEKGDLERALRGFRALLLLRLDAGPISKAEVYRSLGEIHERLGERNKAINMLERALEAEPTLAGARERLERLSAGR
ncbi:MAG: tetratricopeptide repeat protein [Deltaproteobacteria bacterium]|nr:tetratricopeptide repeat protein [Deltaproteobacteria bacterium]